MFDWFRKLLRNAKARSDLLERLEQQAHAAKRQLNDALSLACSATEPEAKVAHLELAKLKFAELQAIAAEHPRMRLTNEKEVDAAIKQMQAAFARAGYYVMADARRKQSVSAHVKLSPTAKDLLR